ncbi:MAG: AAA family ATPase [Helicobacteraceae bacterium]|nr:AAA family ATPase [Helicobacteraceae bacterium]
MAYLLLNFTRNGDNGSDYIQDFYNKPLKEQYRELTARYPQLRRFEEYERFIQICFPAGEQRDYYILMPDFIREGNEDAEAKFFNNIVIRATRNAASEQILPNGLEIILIGNVSMKYGELNVKGFEFIDGSIYKRGEKAICAIAACAFRNRSITANGSTFTVPDYGFVSNEKPSAITRDLMLEMCERYYTVSDPQAVLKTYYKWRDYIDFRMYYLEQQGNGVVPFDEAKAITVYVVSRLDYQPEKYDAYILDGIDQIREKDELVVVTERFENSEPFDIVRVTVDKNKKELFTEVGNEAKTPAFEQMLKRFTRSDIILVNEADEKAAHFVSVDERYKFCLKDIEPDYTKVEANFAGNLKATLAEISSRYAAALKERVNAYIITRAEELTRADNAALTEYANNLAMSFDRDVAENKDGAIRSDYAAQVKAKEDAVRARAEKVKRQYGERIAAVKKNKDKKTDKEVAVEVGRLEAELASELASFTAEMARQKETVSLRALYETRNKKLVAQKEASLRATREEKLRRNISESELIIGERQAPQIEKEKSEAKRKNADELAAKKADMKENDTIRRYYIYFKLRANDTVDGINECIKKYTPKVLKPNQVKEKSKILRQKNALKSFFGGYVKNPFLSTYLFAPNELANAEGAAAPEIDFFSQRLNEKQKEAVSKAIASESIFLLQGPPGTGKTEVIAEIAAQFVKRGKRILISSETHKAIDNVFERLPKIPEIRPLRLIPSQAKQEANLYSPERLVDNFYINISDRLRKEVEIFKHFSDYKEKFHEKFNELNLDYQKLTREKSRIQDVDRTLERIKREETSLAERYDLEREQLCNLRDEKERLSRRLRNIENLTLNEEDDEEIKKFRETLLNHLANYPALERAVETLSFVLRADIGKVKEEIASLINNSALMALEAKRAKIKKQLADLRDPDTDEIIKGKEADFERAQGDLIAVGKEIKAAKESASVDISRLSIAKVVNKSELNPETLGALANTFLKIRGELQDFIDKSRTQIGELIDNAAKEYDEKETKVSNLKIKIREKYNEAKTEKENGDYESYKAIESGLKNKITKFFEDFDIVEPYEDITAALEIIETKWRDLEQNFAARESENKKKIPMYERILKFLHNLQSDDAIEVDREAYTKKLFENANVFGLTCTSRDNFRAASMDSLKKYALDDLDIKRQGIDVVIIDEVSKSSFIDLLIPILYGKTVILVGDHRQLPPMYDLRHMKKDDFEDLDPNMIDKLKNEEYTALYEECFFKTLFESVPDRLRVTLTKQYRCHGDIMKVFNHFYGDSAGRDSLELGAPNQNDQKQHGLHIKGKNGKSIIEIDKHIYFVDCSDSYEKFGDGSSAANETEARVVVELARKIDEAYGRVGGFEVDKTRGKDTRRSMGIICTYGEQAKLIKLKLKKIGRLKNICELHDERFIVSTVDDFQGDERDIIFVSMVRNPAPKYRQGTRAEFVKKFERINVALSRARRLLVIVGAKDFLSSAKIDLPDMSGNKALDRKAYPIYHEIITTILTHGSLLKTSDILEENR